MIGNAFRKVGSWINAHMHIDWHEVSTRAGLILGAMVTGAAQFGQMKPDLAYIGFASTALLVLFKEKPDA